MEFFHFEFHFRLNVLKPSQSEMPTKQQGGGVETPIEERTIFAPVFMRRQFKHMMITSLAYKSTFFTMSWLQFYIY